MGRYGWLLVIGVVLLGALGWFGAGKTLAEDDTHLGPPVVVPTPTAPPSPPTPTEEPTLDTSQSPAPPPADSSTGSETPNGADRIKPGPPRTAGHDDDDDGDDIDDIDDADDDDTDDDDDHDDADDDHDDDD